MKQIFLAGVIISCCAVLSAVADKSRNDFVVKLDGEVGRAADNSINRFGLVPYDSLAWLRADLTGEKVSEFDDKWGHIRRRPYKNYSGDISGRFIEIMAMNSRGSYEVHPLLKELLAEVPKHQRPGGYFAACGTIDWQQPIDFKVKGGGSMMPGLWGNSRLLCGLVEACRAFKDPALLATARKLGDFYVGLIPRFADPARMNEYTGGDTYASGYVTCYFPAMEGLVKLHDITGEENYLDTAITMAAFYKQFDRLPVDHAHGMLCNQVSLLMLYEVTKDALYLERVEKRWNNLVEGGYINPAGGILEKCWVKNDKDEGCAIADWLRLNLELARVTGKTRYWAMAERTLHNHFLQNQTPNGGFGHRRILCDEQGVLGFAKDFHEALWCCSFHGQLGFVNLRNHLVARTDTELTVNFPLDFSCSNAAGTVVSGILPAAGAGEVMRQRIRIEGGPPMILQVRQPHWADGVTAVDAGGKGLPLLEKETFLATSRPVSDVVFIYKGGVYAESRRCVRLPGGPVAGEPCVFGYGPKILAALGRTTTKPVWPVSLEQLKEQGLIPFSDAMRMKDCSFVCTETEQKAGPSGLRIDVGAIEKARILKAAEEALNIKPITITAFRAEHSAGGQNDFYSNGDYWWPNPATSNGLPYVQRDGQTNPGNFVKHRLAVRDLRNAVAALGAAYKIRWDDRYAAKAAELLRVFFVDAQTRMNPSLKYAQAIPGVSTGRGVGIIDTLHLVEVPRAVEAMQKSPAFSADVLKGLKQWFRDYSEWLLTSKNGNDEADANNNHAVAFWLQVAVFAGFAGDEANIVECRRQFKENFVVKQMASDGSFPAELKRTKPYGYSVFQLENMVTLCQVLSTKEDNLWNFQTPDGKSISKAMEYLFPYLADKSKWPLKPDVQAWEGWPSRQSCLLFAGLALGEQKYIDLWKRLPPDPADDEVKRNIAITQPVLWLQPCFQ